MVAVTLQLAAALALSEPEVEIVQWAPATTNLSAPVPEPPEVVTLTDVPTVAVNEVLAIFNVFCAMVAAPAVDVTPIASSNDALSDTVAKRAPRARPRPVTKAEAAVPAAAMDETNLLFTWFSP